MIHETELHGGIPTHEEVRVRGFLDAVSIEKGEPARFCPIGSIREGSNGAAMFKEKGREFSRADLDRIIMMAWEDRTSFDAIRTQFGLEPGEVIKLMRQELKENSFRLWRARTSGRSTKHERRFLDRVEDGPVRRFRAKSQRG